MAEEIKIFNNYLFTKGELEKIPTKTKQERIDEILSYPPIIARGTRDDLIVYDPKTETVNWKEGLKEQWLEADESHLIMLNNVFRNKYELQTRRY